MNFSDVVKQHTDEKHLKLLSGEAERTTTDVKIESCDSRRTDKQTNEHNHIQTVYLFIYYLQAKKCATPSEVAHSINRPFY